MIEVDDNPSFQKQRRNLLVISSIILFLKIGNVSFSNTVHLPLIDVNISSPKAITIFLHIFLFYFLWRFFISLHKIGLNIVNRPVKEAIKTAMKNKANERARAKAKLENIQTLSGTGIGIHHEAPIDKTGKGITKRGAIYTCRYLPANGGEEQFTIKITGTTLYCIRAKAYFTHLLTKDLFIEYFLPLAIFSLALLASLNVKYVDILFFKFYW